MTNAVEVTIKNCREKGIDTISTSTHSSWPVNEHQDMLMLQQNPPADINVSLNIKFGVHDWTLIRIGGKKQELHGVVKRSYTLNLGFDMLKTQKEGLLAILSDDNNKEAVERFHLDGIIALIDSIQDQAVDQHGLPEKEVFHLTDTDEDCTDIEHPVTISPIYDSVAYAQGQIRMFDAYQHFLYYFDQKHFEANSPLGDHMTRHMIEKLTGMRLRISPDFNSIELLVKWMQEMSPAYQDSMLGYMLKYHSGKGGGFRSWK